MAEPTDDLVDALVQTAFEVTAVLQRVAASHDLSLTQMRVLGILQDRQVRMSVLAGYLGLERSTLSGFVDRAEGRGLLVRVPGSADGRVVEVTLSAPGRRLARRIYREVETALTVPIASLTGAETHRLQVLLQRFLAGGRQL